MTEIYVALITGGLSLLGVFISNTMAARQTAVKIETNQAVTNEKISELTREVREHNDFARRIPVMENDIKTLYHKIDEIKK